jgi:hypothetical protein
VTDEHAACREAGARHAGHLVQRTSSPTAGITPSVGVIARLGTWSPAECSQHARRACPDAAPFVTRHCSYEDDLNSVGPLAMSSRLWMD